MRPSAIIDTSPIEEVVIPIFVGHGWFVDSFKDEVDRAFVDNILTHKMLVEIVEGTATKDGTQIFGIQVCGGSFILGWYDTYLTAKQFCDWFFLPILSEITKH